jgi:hypothetical protein
MEKARACGIPDICAPECSVWSVGNGRVVLRRVAGLCSPSLHPLYVNHEVRRPVVSKRHRLATGRRGLMVDDKEWTDTRGCRKLHVTVEQNPGPPAFFFHG